MAMSDDVGMNTMWILKHCRRRQVHRKQAHDADLDIAYTRAGGHELVAYQLYGEFEIVQSEEFRLSRRQSLCPFDSFGERKQMR